MVLSPPPKIGNTICEHNCANWKAIAPFFCILVLVFAVSVFRLFWRGMRNQQKTNIETKQQEQTKPQDANKKAT